MDSHRVGALFLLAAAALWVPGCGDPVPPAVQNEPAPANGGGTGTPANVAKTEPTPVVPVAPAQPESPYRYGYIGGTFGDLPAEAAARLGIPGGCLTARVDPGEPAAVAGLQRGDVVVAVDGKPVPNARFLIDRLKASTAGTRLRLDVRRGTDKVGLDVSVKEKAVAPAVEQLRRSAADWLVRQQRADGSWPHAAKELIEMEGNPSISYTALSLSALAGLPAELRTPHQPAIDKAVAYLMAHRMPDGGVHDPNEQSAVVYRNFANSFLLQALVLLDKTRYAKEIAELAGFLVKRQLDEEEGFRDYDWHHGGWNYYEEVRNYSLRADLVTAGLMLRALAAAEVPATEPVWGKARIFVERSQNFVDDPNLRTPLHDGGFFFNPRSSKAGEKRVSASEVHFNSYGTPTCDGIACLATIGLRPQDPRVSAALGWLQAHYSIKENPGFAADAPIRFQEGIYYYYLYALSQAMSAVGREVLTTPDQRTHYWVRDLADQLQRLQRPDGSWVNRLNIMTEDDPIVATGLSLHALNTAAKFLR